MRDPDRGVGGWTAGAGGGEQSGARLGVALAGGFLDDGGGVGEGGGEVGTVQGVDGRVAVMEGEDEGLVEKLYIYIYGVL